MSFHNAIFLRARTDPHKPAIFLPDRVITYGMIASGTRSVERKFEELGIARGCGLAAIDIANPARHIIVLLALWRQGIPSVSIRPDLVAPAVAAGCRFFLSDAATKPIEGARQFIVTEDWFTSPPAGPIPFSESLFEDDDVFRVTFSSGSTGRPKPIAHSQGAYQRRIVDTLLTSFPRPWSRLLITGGVSTGFGAARALQALWLGLTVSFAFLADDAARMISHFGVEAVMGSPMQVLDLMRWQEQIRSPCRRSPQFNSAAARWRLRT